MAARAKVNPWCFLVPLVECGRRRDGLGLREWSGCPLLTGVPCTWGSRAVPTGSGGARTSETRDRGSHSSRPSTSLVAC